MYLFVFAFPPRESQSEPARSLFVSPDVQTSQSAVQVGRKVRLDPGSHQALMVGHSFSTCHSPAGEVERVSTNIASSSTEELQVPLFPPGLEPHGLSQEQHVPPQVRARRGATKLSAASLGPLPSGAGRKVCEPTGHHVALWRLPGVLPSLQGEVGAADFVDRGRSLLPGVGLWLNMCAGLRGCVRFAAGRLRQGCQCSRRNAGRSRTLGEVPLFRAKGRRRWHQ